MKPPKFTGHRKGKAELWLGEPLKAYEGYPRIRCRFPNGQWVWHWADNFERLWKEMRGGSDYEPCWIRDKRFYAFRLVDRMRRYDYQNCHETIFLGYF